VHGHPWSARQSAELPAPLAGPPERYSHDRTALALAAVHDYQVAYHISCGIFLFGAVVAAALLNGRPAPDSATGDRPSAADTNPL